MPYEDHCFYIILRLPHVNVNTPKTTPLMAEIESATLVQPRDAPASNWGDGALDILELTKVLEGAEIPCCIVGVSALIYYGAPRMRNDWEICVPTESLDSAFGLLKSEPHNEKYEVSQHEGPPHIYSLLHTFPRMKIKGIDLYFDLIPSEDCHIVCEPSNFERSKMGLPYPNLVVFAQSVLDTLSGVPLQDLIDGMDLTEDWGEKNLDLSGTNDEAWAHRKNEKIREAAPLTTTSCFLEVDTGPLNRREIWKEVVSTKGRRIGLELPKGYYATNYRLIGDPDPRTTERYYC